MKIKVIAFLFLLFPFASQASQIKIGQYTGNGLDNRSISVGFQPDFVLISGQCTCSTVARTSAQTGDITVSIGPDEASQTNRIQALEADGFQIGSSSTVNTDTETYEYIAIKDTGDNDYAAGVYVGTGGDDRDFTGLGFQPDMVLVKATSTARAIWRHSSQAGDASLPFIETSAVSNRIQSFAADGFQLGTDAQVNASPVGYMWVALKDVGDIIKFGTYVGNATDDTDITGIGFDPEFLWLKMNNGTDGHTMHAFQAWALNEAKPFSAFGWPVSNTIQDLITDGFQLGTSRVNTSGVTGYYIAFDTGTTAVAAASPEPTRKYDDIIWFSQ